MVKDGECGVSEFVTGDNFSTLESKEGKNRLSHRTSRSYTTEILGCWRKI